MSRLHSPAGEHQDACKKKEMKPKQGIGTTESSELTKDVLQPSDLPERGRRRRRGEDDVAGVVEPLHLAQRHDVRWERHGHGE